MYQKINKLLVFIGLLIAFVVLLCYIFQINTCVAARVGTTCILCGCTRDFVGFLCGSFTCQNALSIPFLLLLVAELLYRVRFSLVKAQKEVIYIDIFAHSILVAVLVLKSVLFYF